MPWTAGLRGLGSRAATGVAGGFPGGGVGWHQRRAVLALAGAIDAGGVTFAALERRARAWLPAVPGSQGAATDPPTEVAAACAGPLSKLPY